ncbi:MoaD/ThiS family protein [Candidatus Woesearchaeota archaeon]|nr:MoaD/ThiS family protein [Candidatus Woesearchaeota archaeon]
MEVELFIEKENRKKMIKLEEGAILKDVLEMVNVNPVTIIASRNNEIILEDDKLNDKDKIKLLSVISGG